MATAGAINRVPLMHPLNQIWRCWVTDPDPSADVYERALFVEAYRYEEAKQRVAAITRMLFENRPGWDDAGDHFYNLTSFQELAEHSDGPSTALRLFESGWQGPQVIGWASAPMIVARSWASIILADVAANLPRLPYAPGQPFIPTAWKRLSRGASQQHPDAQRHTARVHMPLDSMKRILGKPDATLLDWVGPNWSITWPDGLVARIFGKARGFGTGIWTVAGDDLRAIGRVMCILEDGRFAPACEAGAEQNGS